MNENEKTLTATEGKEKELHHIDGYLRKFKSKDGRTFASFSIKGAYIPVAVQHDMPFEEDEYYSVRAVNYALPDYEGKFRIYFYAGDAWLDNREPEKRIIRIRPMGCEKQGAFKAKKAESAEEPF